MKPAIWCWDDHLRCWKKLIIFLNRTLRKQATGWRYQWKDLNSKYLSLTLVFNILILLFDKRCPAKLTNTWYGCIKPHCSCTRQKWTAAYSDNISRKLCYLWYSLDSWFVSHATSFPITRTPIRKSHIQKTRYWSCVCMFTASEPFKLVLDVYMLGHSSNRSLHDGSLETNTFAYQDGIQKCRLARLLQAYQSNVSFLLKERILYPVNTHFLHSNMDASRTIPGMEHSYLSQTTLQAQSIDEIWRRLFQLWQNNRPLGSLLILYSEEVDMKLMKNKDTFFFSIRPKFVRRLVIFMASKCRLALETKKWQILRDNRGNESLTTYMCVSWETNDFSRWDKCCMSIERKAGFISNNRSPVWFVCLVFMSAECGIHRMESYNETRIFSTNVQTWHW